MKKVKCHLQLLSLVASLLLATLLEFLPIPMHFSRWGANLIKANDILNFFFQFALQLVGSKPACCQSSFAVWAIDLIAKVYIYKQIQQRYFIMCCFSACLLKLHCCRRKMYAQIDDSKITDLILTLLVIDCALLFLFSSCFIANLFVLYPCTRFYFGNHFTYVNFLAIFYGCLVCFFKPIISPSYIVHVRVWESIADLPFVSKALSLCSCCTFFNWHCLQE